MPGVVDDDHGRFVGRARVVMDILGHSQVSALPTSTHTRPEVAREAAAQFREQFWFMRWGEILDNVSTYAYLDDDLVTIFAFWRATHPFPEDLGKVFVARLPPEEFVATVEEAADLLDAGFVAVDPAPVSE